MLNKSSVQFAKNTLKIIRREKHHDFITLVSLSSPGEEIKSKIVVGTKIMYYTLRYLDELDTPVSQVDVVTLDVHT